MIYYLVTDGIATGVTEAEFIRVWGGPDVRHSLGNVAVTEWRYQPDAEADVMEDYGR